MMRGGGPTRLGVLRILAVLLLLVPAAVSEAAFQDLRVGVGNRNFSLSSRSHDGRAYYPVSEIADLLDFSLAERGGLLGISGTRGRLQLTAGRPLVRFHDQYLLLSAPVWRRAPGEWYVPEDFLSKVAPLLIEARIEKLGDRRYRLEALGENRVRVQVVNYPDHVAVIFVPSRPAPIRVQEFSRYVRVSFEESVVVPELPETAADPALVARIRFDAGEIYGSFEIFKGPDYHSYRDYDLADPARKVVGIYGPPVLATAPVAADPIPSAPRSAGEVELPLPLLDDEAVREFERPDRDNAVTIDPGHGGENYGVHSSQETLEKNFTQKLAEEVSRQLNRKRYRLFLTRSRDINLSPGQRSSLANFNQSKAFISLHFGGSHEPSVRGPVVYVQEPIDAPLGSPRLVPWELGQQRYLKQSRQLAESLQERLNEVFATDNEVVEAPLEVLAPVANPAVLIEAGFLTNPRDRELISDPEGLRRIGRAVVEALQDFLP